MMKEAKLFVLLSSLWSGALGLTNTTLTRTTTTKEKNFQKNMTSTSYALNQAQSLQMMPTTQIMTLETTAKTRSSENSLLTSTLLPSETEEPPETRRIQAPTKEKTEEVLKMQTLAPLSKSSIQSKPKPREESLVLPNSTLKFLQSFARNSNQQAMPSNSTGSLGNRATGEMYLSRGDNPRSQRTNSQKSSFETTRAK